MVYSIVPRNGLPPGECVCLFIWSLCPIREFFTHMETSPLPVKAANLTYARKSWPLSSESYLTCHTYCDTGLPFIIVISEDPWHSHLLPSVWQWSCHYLFLRLRSVATGDQTPISHMRGELSTVTPPRRFIIKQWWNHDIIIIPYQNTFYVLSSVILFDFKKKAFLIIQ